MNRKKAFGVMGLVLMVVLGVYRRAHRGNTLPSETEMVAIMTEAMGTESIPGNDTPIRKAIRDSFKYLLDEDKSYEDKASQRYRTKYMSNLLRPYSFVVDPYRQGAVTELRSLKDLDQQHIAELQRFPEVARSNLISAGVSEADANTFAEGIKKGGGGASMEQLSRDTDLEMKWIDSLLELYHFAEDNRTHMGMPTTDELTFDDENVRSQFMAFANKADALAAERTKVSAASENGLQRRRPQISFTAHGAN